MVPEGEGWPAAAALPAGGEFLQCTEFDHPAAAGAGIDYDRGNRYGGNVGGRHCWTGAAEYTFCVDWSGEIRTEHSAANVSGQRCRGRAARRWEFNGKYSHNGTGKPAWSFVAAGALQF